MNSSTLLEKLKEIRSEADSLVSVNQNKQKENDEKHEKLKAEIMKKTMQMVNSLFEHQIELNDKANQLQNDLTMNLNNLMNEKQNALNKLQDFEIKTNSAEQLNHDELKKIEIETEKMEKELKMLKTKIIQLDFNYYLKSNESNLTLGELIFVSIIL